MYNEIFIRRANKVLAPNIVYNLDDAIDGVGAIVASFDANLRALGYALDPALWLNLLRARSSDLTEFCVEVLEAVKELKGVRDYRPMYPNFPVQVMEASEAELYLNAVMHYAGTVVGVRVLPQYEKAKRKTLNFDESKLIILREGDYEEFTNLMVSLFKSKSAWSPTDKADVAALDVVTFADVYNRASSEIANRENKATIGAEVLSRDLNIIHKMDTATDVLRLAVAMSGGDVSLSEKTNFKSFKRSERRMLLGMLEEMSGVSDDMLRRPETFKRLGERLHPGEYAKVFPLTSYAFGEVRAGNGTTFNAMVEQAIRLGDVSLLVSTLKNRPGDFARRLDAVLRLAPNAAQQRFVLSNFADVAHKVSPTVLLQARNAFVNRDKDIRVFFPKGSVAKMQSKTDERRKINKAIVNVAVGVFDTALTKSFASRPSLGWTWIDPALKGIAVPFGQRNASKQLKTLGRGSRLSLGDDTNVVRFFIWWKDAPSGGWGYGSHTDLDLSAVCFGSDFDFHSAITFYNLREEGAVHSGDITSAPNGASEFIDIDINRLKERGVRYVAMTVHSYSGQEFVELPECFAGFMEREDLGSGEIYDPRTVTNKADLTAKSRGATPFIFDLDTGEAIWVDLSMMITQMAGNVANSRGQITSLVEAMTTLTPPNLYDLFMSHVLARGALTTRDKADTVFSFDGDVTPFDIEKILDEYL